jgi:hypothetical protein
MQQQQRELSALKERVEETRYQMGRQLGQSSREGDQRVKDLEGASRRWPTRSKRGEALKARDDEIKQLRETMETTQKAMAEPHPSRRCRSGDWRKRAGEAGYEPPGGCWRKRLSSPSGVLGVSRSTLKASWRRTPSIGL